MGDLGRWQKNPNRAFLPHRTTPLIIVVVIHHWNRTNFTVALVKRVNLAEIQFITQKNQLHAYKKNFDTIVELGTCTCGKKAPLFFRLGEKLLRSQWRLRSRGHWWALCGLDHIKHEVDLLDFFFSRLFSFFFLFFFDRLFNESPGYSLDSFITYRLDGIYNKGDVMVYK